MGQNILHVVELYHIQSSPLASIDELLASTRERMQPHPIHPLSSSQHHLGSEVFPLSWESVKLGTMLGCPLRSIQLVFCMESHSCDQCPATWGWYSCLRMQSTYACYMYSRSRHAKKGYNATTCLLPTSTQVCGTSRAIVYWSHVATPMIFPVNRYL